eukprot:TRINITY_DN453_c0_g2_i1.p1 TRINITY_DN453_c0_g2~~TRINITY_DN453_c0_g2_i1.p1  ORF type:complete len:398 (+),score=231.56 TRINITY_DN453_c0_g2_i1:148-1194(+)
MIKNKYISKKKKAIQTTPKIKQSKVKKLVDKFDPELNETNSNKLKRQRSEVEAEDQEYFEQVLKKETRSYGKKDARITEIEEKLKSIEDPKERLRQKIALLREKRSASEVDVANAPPKKRQKIERREKKRAETVDRRQKIKHDEAALKQIQKALSEGEVATFQHKSDPSSLATDTFRKSQLTKAIREESKKEQKLIKRSQPAPRERETNLEFGTFVTAPDGSTAPDFLKRKPSKFDQLKRAEAEKQKIDELKKSSSGKDELAQIKLQKALARARGEKIKDDPTKLKKSLKKKEKKKEKSRKEWNERIATETKKMEDRQKLRKANIQKKKDRSAGKRPGFEGKKKKFLN